MNRSVFFLLFLVDLFVFHAVSAQDTSRVILREFEGGNKLAAKNGKWGVIGPGNEIIYPFELYDSYKNYGNGLLRIKQEWPDSVYYSEEKVFKPIRTMRYGLIDARTGRIIFPPIYNYIGDFKNRRAVISSPARLSGIINDSGRILIPISYKTLSELPNGNYVGRQGDTLRFLGSSLSTISTFTNLLRFEPSAEHCIFIYRMKDREGLANCDGKVVGDSNWVSVMDTKRGLAFVRTTKKHYAVYDIGKRKTIIDGDFQNFYFFDNSNVILMLSNDRYTAFDLTGKKTGGFTGLSVENNNGYGFFVKRNELWGYADKNGNMSVQPVWKNVERFSTTSSNFKATTDGVHWKNYTGEGKPRQ